jgi:hypothetical protein
MFNIYNIGIVKVTIYRNNHNGSQSIDIWVKRTNVFHCLVSNSEFHIGNIKMLLSLKRDDNNKIQWNIGPLTIPMEWKRL